MKKLSKEAQDLNNHLRFYFLTVIYEGDRHAYVSFAEKKNKTKFDNIKTLSKFIGIPYDNDWDVKIPRERYCEVLPILREHGSKTAERTARKRLSRDEKRIIIADKRSFKAIAEEYRISVQTIFQIKNGIGKTNKELLNEAKRRHKILKVGNQ